jgi:hypothetical protein
MEDSLLTLTNQAKDGLNANLAAVQQYYQAMTGQVGGTSKTAAYLAQAIETLRSEAGMLTDQMLQSQSDFQNRIAQMSSNLGRVMIYENF